MGTRNAVRLVKSRRLYEQHRGVAEDALTTLPGSRALARSRPLSSCSRRGGERWPVAYRYIQRSPVSTYCAVLYFFTSTEIVSLPP